MPTMREDAGESIENHLEIQEGLDIKDLHANLSQLRVDLLQKIDKLSDDHSNLVGKHAVLMIRHADLKADVAILKTERDAARAAANDLLASPMTDPASFKTPEMSAPTPARTIHSLDPVLLPRSLKKDLDEADAYDSDATQTY
jgi:hypothetical protein